MTVLVLGGTRFVGRHIVAEALARGHKLTLFNRGRTNPDLFPDAERIVGDRQGDHSELRGRRWDVAIDTSGTEPDQVERACAALAGNVSRYVYTSSSAAYQPSPEPFTEQSPLRTPPTTGELDYGEKKSRSEQVVAEFFNSDSRIIVRPAVLVGPHDSRPRFISWPLRARAGGEMLAPGSPEFPVPLTDARDLAAWLMTQIERGTAGIFNIGGPGHTMGALIDAARAYGPATPVWVDAAWLSAQRISFDSLPSLRLSGYDQISSARAVAEGLQFRGLAESMADTVAWWDAQTDPPAPHRLSRAREQDLLTAWRLHNP